MSEYTQVVIELRNSRPVELGDFARSMLALGSEYEHYLDCIGARGAVPDSRLSIREMREGSIIATLGPAEPVVVQMTSQVNVVWSFASNLAAALTWLIDSRSERPRIDQETLRNISKFVKPVAEDRSAQLNISSMTSHGMTHLHVAIDSLQANAVQNAVNRELKALKASVSGLKESVALYWDHDSSAEKGCVGDRARIDSIYEAPVRVKFENDELKRVMLHEQHSPSSKAFIVDVLVEGVGPRPFLYKILSLKDVVELP